MKKVYNLGARSGGIMRIIFCSLIKIMMPLKIKTVLCIFFLNSITSEGDSICKFKSFASNWNKIRHDITSD